MGDRNTIVIDEQLYPTDKGYGHTYLYGHWIGSRAVQAVLDGIMGDRATDTQYCARQIFQSMLAGDDSGLSFGIGSQFAESEYPVIHVSPDNQRIAIHDRNDKELLTTCSYAVFIEAAQLAKEEGFDTVRYSYDKLLNALEYLRD